MKGVDGGVALNLVASAENKFALSQDTTAEILRFAQDDRF